MRLLKVQVLEGIGRKSQGGLTRRSGGASVCQRRRVGKIKKSKMKMCSFLLSLFQHAPTSLDPV
jgi:hypothetical protein